MPRKNYSTLEQAYEQIQLRINNQHHNYQTQFPRYANTDADYAMLEYYARVAEHVHVPSGNGEIDEKLVV